MEHDHEPERQAQVPLPPPVRELLSRHGRTLAVLLCAMGFLGAASQVIGGTLWKEKGRGELRASLLQVESCDDDARGGRCYPVHNPNAFPTDDWYETFRYSALASLFLFVVGGVTWLSNRLPFGGNVHFPEINALTGLGLASEVLAVLVILPFLLPSGWGVAAGYIGLLFCVLALMAGCGLLRLRPAPEPSSEPEACPPEAPAEPKVAPMAEEPAAPATPEEPGSPPAPGAPASPPCVKCGGPTAYVEQALRFRCQGCGLYQPSGQRAR